MYLQPGWYALWPSACRASRRTLAPGPQPQASGVSVRVGPAQQSKLRLSSPGIARPGPGKHGRGSRILPSEEAEGKVRILVSCLVAGGYYVHQAGVAKLFGVVGA